MIYRVPMGFTLDDLERLKVKVTILWFEMSWKRWQIRGWTPGRTFLKAAMGFRLAQSDLTLDDLEGQQPRSQFLMWNMWTTVRVTMSDPMTWGHVDSSSLDLLPNIFGLLVCSGCLRRGLTQGDEIWQDGRPGRSSPLLVNFGPGVSPPRPKSKRIDIGQSLARYDKLAGGVSKWYIRQSG